VALVCSPDGILVGEARSISELECHFLPDMVRPIRPGRDLSVTAALVRLLRRGRFHLVHTHSSKAGIVGRLAAHLAGVPVVIHSIHGFGFNRFQPPPLRAALLAAEHQAARFTSHFIAVSRANLELGLAEGLYAAEDVSLIYSGIPLAEYLAPDAGEAASVRAEFGLPAGSPLVTMVACFKPQKDPLSFVEAAAAVSRERPDARFLLVGDGVLGQAVHERAASLKLDRVLVLTGWRRDVPRLIRASDVLVLTSLWEGLPRVVPQAMAAAKPVVATAVDGTPEAVNEGETGHLVPPGRPPLVAARVLGLLSDPERARAMGRTGRLRVKPWDIDLMVPAQEHLYQRLLARAGVGYTLAGVPT
jgi:glycosyltransferase involved in cell wall biosynthesis